MPARAHFATYALDSEGRPIPGATVEVREPDTETLISETIFEADDPDTDEKTNPFTGDADGKVEIWLTNPKVVDLYVTKTGYTPSTIRATAHQLTASTLVFSDDGTPLAQRAGVNFIGGFTLTDDAGNDETEVALDYAEDGDISTQAFGDAASAGTGDEVPRAGHKHGMPATPVAADIAITDAGAHFTADDVEDALTELAVAAAAEVAAREAHEADATGAHAASAISITDAAGDFDATNVEDALAELETEADTDAAALAAHLGDGTDAHDASAISILDSGADFTATTVEGALAELQADNEAHADAATHGVRAHGDWDPLDHSGVVFVHKTVDEVISASTVLQVDNVLEFPVGADETWEFELVIGYASATGVDFKFDFSIPAAGSILGMVERLLVSASSRLDRTAEYVTDLTADQSAGGIGTAAGDIVPLKVTGIYVGGANAGDVIFRWAQDTSGGSNTTVFDGFLTARRVA